MTQKQKESKPTAGSPSGPRDRKSAARVADYFVACPRCSYFLAGYRLIEQDFDDAAVNAIDDWLNLSWSMKVRDLVQKSYGYDFDEGLQVLQGVCPECRRAFIFEAAEQGTITRFMYVVEKKLFN